jgi:Tol biopolymer transport system component/lysophospholipase L1-like esterase
LIRTAPQPLGVLLAAAVTMLCVGGTSPLAGQDDRLHTDWAFLTRYRDANARLGPPAAGEQRVVFYGNSITEGWAQYFDTMFPGKPYVGRGISGQTTPQMLVRFRQDVIALEPTVVVILAGTNDIAGNTGPSTLAMIEDNLMSMIELARANDIRVVLSSVLPAYDYPWRPGLEPAEKIVALNAWMRDYASAHDVVFLDYHAAMADERQGLRAELTYDGVHPNEAGYRVMAPLAERAIARALGQGNIRSTLATVDIGSGHIDTVYGEWRHFEAPNWSPDGRYFIVNSGGRLYRVSADAGGGLVEIPTGFATRLNNDHGISPDGRRLAISHSAEEHIPEVEQAWMASSIYVLPIEGSPAPEKVTTRVPSFWHGWSPDGATLVYTARRDGAWDVYAIPVTGGEERRLTACPGLDDGPDYAPDGSFIYYNSFCSGSMEIWRMRPDGSEHEQLTDDAHSNWFPHPSPDGRWVVFITYLEDQGEAHPFGRQVKLRLMDVRDGSVRDLTPTFFGGQGSLNVPPWSPDGRHVAFVIYEER